MERMENGTPGAPAPRANDGSPSVTQAVETACATALEARGSRYVFDIGCRQRYYAARVAFFERVERGATVALLLLATLTGAGLFIYGAERELLLVFALVAVLAYLFAGRLARWEQAAPAPRVVLNALCHNAQCQSMGMPETCLIRVSGRQRRLASWLDIDAAAVRQAFRRLAGEGERNGAVDVLNPDGNETGRNACNDDRT